MWHKLGFSNQTESLHGALDSLIIGLVYQKGSESLSIDELNSEIQRFLSTLEESKKREVTGEALKRLHKRGTIALKGDVIKLCSGPVKTDSFY